MTSNKPEVFRFDCHGYNAPAYSCNKPLDNSGEYVRLSDYEALQADRDQQYDMKVKAREQREEVTAKLSALYDECEKLRKDAERYRWLRDGNDEEESEAVHIAVHHHGDKWDEMIDTAMDEESK